MLEDGREDGVQSPRATSFSETGGRVVRMGVDAGKLVGSWRSFCRIDSFFSVKEKAETVAESEGSGRNISSVMRWGRTSLLSNVGDSPRSCLRTTVGITKLNLHQRRRFSWGWKPHICSVSHLSIWGISLAVLNSPGAGEKQSTQLVLWKKFSLQVYLNNFKVSTGRFILS